MLSGDQNSQLSGQGIMMLMVYAGKKTLGMDAKLAVRRSGVNTEQASAQQTHQLAKRFTRFDYYSIRFN